MLVDLRNPSAYNLDKIKNLEHAWLIFSRLEKNMNGSLDFYEILFCTKTGEVNIFLVVEVAQAVG